MLRQLAKAVPGVMNSRVISRRRRSAAPPARSHIRPRAQMISAARNYHELLLIFSQQGQQMNHIHLSSMWNRLGQLWTKARRSKHADEPMYLDQARLIITLSRAVTVVVEPVHLDHERGSPSLTS